MQSSLNLREDGNVWILITSKNVAVLLRNIITVIMFEEENETEVMID